ncbi:hypothetical protein ACWED2_27445 [Amycolatopsis sp. NPDC005003]
MNGCPLGTTQRDGAVEDAMGEPEPPMPIAFCPEDTAAPGVLVPRANWTFCAASFATQSQPYFCA